MWQDEFLKSFKSFILFFYGSEGDISLPSQGFWNLNSYFLGKKNTSTPYFVKCLCIVTNILKVPKDLHIKNSGTWEI